MATLLGDIARYLVANDVNAALIGAAAVSFHGFTRSTLDEDLLTVDRKVLKRDFWAAFDPTTDVDVRVGDYDDPLAGVVKFRRRDALVDLVVGRHRFEKEAVEQAIEGTAGGVTLRVVRAADLLLLKLAAGGPIDQIDITKLLTIVDPSVTAEVDSRLHLLPPDARELWARIRAS